MFRLKLALAVGVLFSVFIRCDLAQAQTPPLDANTVSIEVAGTVPGFTPERLSAYIAGHMQSSVPGTWHFVVKDPKAQLAPNRVVWSIAVLRKVWPSGSHNGFPSPSHSVSYLSAEAKLYLGGAYQMTMSSRPSVHGGIDDHALSEMVSHTTHALFEDTKGDAR